LAIDIALASSATKLMLHGQLYDTPDNARGIDCNTPIDARIAATLITQGYKFAHRYVRRAAANARDLSADEANIILAAGLGISVVQHVTSATSWVPSPSDGTRYGETAAAEVERLGFPSGSMIACDLEGVTPGTTHQIVMDYARAWYAAVQAAGFLPELYVGWHCGLTPAELYDLPFTRYWGAYNLNTDEEPAVRGLCMKQRAATPADGIMGIPFDVDIARADRKGDRAVMFAPFGWAPEDFSRRAGPELAHP
jgi:hypothetical protein